MISDFTITVRNFSYSMENSMFEGTISLLVPNNDVLYAFMKKIQSIKGVLKVVRQNN